ncbi:hypothetical protein ABIA27_006382 [Sinorhizobium fredii]
MIESVAERTSRMVFCRVENVSLTFFCSSAKAPWKRPSMLSVRSPAARLAITRRVSAMPLSTLPTSSLTLAAKRFRSSLS